MDSRGEDPQPTPSLASAPELQPKASGEERPNVRNCTMVCQARHGRAIGMPARCRTSWRTWYGSAQVVGKLPKNCALPPATDVESATNSENSRASANFAHSKNTAAHIHELPEHELSVPLLMQQPATPMFPLWLHVVPVLAVLEKNVGVCACCKLVCATWSTPKTLKVC